MPSLITEHQQWFDESTGALIVSGSMYIGTQNLDPEANPITVYSDRSLATAITNPVPIGADGRATSKVWIPAKYSMKITDSSDVQKFIDLDRGSDTELGNTKLINSLGINAVTATSSPSIEGYVGGQTYIFSAPADNTGAMTLKIDSLAVTDIKKGHDQAMASGDIKADQQIVVVYNSTDDWFEIQSGVLSPVFSGSITVVGNVAAANLLNVKVIDIGDWDMSTATGDASVAIAHGLTLSKIRTINVLIRTDDDASYLDFASSSGGSNEQARADSTYINITRGGGGEFDNTNYNATSYNRGWITIQYVD